MLHIEKYPYEAHVFSSVVLSTLTEIIRCVAVAIVVCRVCFCWADRKEGTKLDQDRDTRKCLESAHLLKYLIL